MDKFASIAKGGWHPERNNSSSSSYGEKKGIRDRAKGLMGKGSDPHEAANNHQSRPLSTLRDPASFAPPPKHHAYYGGGQSYGAPTSSATPASSGLGAPIPQEQLQAREERERQRAAAAAAEEEANRPPSGPYRADTTGLSTQHLPKPPVRRAGTDSPAPASPVSRSPAPAPAPAANKPGPPRLPPRLPPRQNSHPDAYSAPPPPTYQESVQSPPANNGLLNQGAISRLGQSGISVPGLNIGRNASPPVPARNASQSPSVPARIGQTPPTQSPATTGHGGQLSELQSRFARMTTSSPTATSPQEGTTFAQKQAAFNTANAFRTNPSSVSASDLRSAASTANNFRQRHGEQVASGVQAANGINQKYGVMNRVNGFASGSGTTASPPPAGPNPVGKKPPPPPPKKKTLSGDTGGSGTPPPIPLGSKPRP